MPLTTAAAYFCRPSDCRDQRLIGRVLHVAEFDEHRRILRQVEPGEVRAAVEAVLADVVRRRNARGLQLVAHDPRKLDRRPGLGLVQRRCRVVDVEPAAGRRARRRRGWTRSRSGAARWPSPRVRRRTGASALSLPRDIAVRTPSWFSIERIRSTVLPGERVFGIAVVGRWCRRSGSPSCRLARWAPAG